MREVGLHPHFSDGKTDSCRLKGMKVQMSRELDSGQAIPTCVS